jgi:hypothetical protein
LEVCRGDLTPLGKGVILILKAPFLGVSSRWSGAFHGIFEVVGDVGYGPGTAEHHDTREKLAVLL